MCGRRFAICYFGWICAAFDTYIRYRRVKLRTFADGMEDFLISTYNRKNRLIYELMARNVHC
ncbi:hypothetical protein AAC03nite_27090 [Alicyclobacillus acidoterrestris]|nr:hypothetical protein AAC03nite_27090 [Alicyclobacillus acidoterrestris]